jgi:hypothetical protein
MRQRVSRRKLKSRQKRKREGGKATERKKSSAGTAGQ